MCREIFYPCQNGYCPLIGGEKRGIYGVWISTKNEEFAEVLEKTLNDVGMKHKLRLCENGVKIYFYGKSIVKKILEKTNQARSGKMNKDMLIGIFDASGKINLRRRVHKNGKIERCWRIRLTHKDKDILWVVRNELLKLGITSHVYKNGPSFTLEISGKNNFSMFSEKVGSKMEDKKRFMELALSNFDRAIRIKPNRGGIAIVEE